MSRMAAALLALIASTTAQATQSLTAVDAMSRYQEMTRGNPDCRHTQAGDEIVVCGRRDADRYRVPLVTPEAGDPRIETVSAERERYQHQTTPCQDHGAFLVGCGMVGLSVGISSSGRVQYRKLAN